MNSAIHLAPYVADGYQIPIPYILTVPSTIELTHRARSREGLPLAPYAPRMDSRWAKGIFTLDGHA